MSGNVVDFSSRRIIGSRALSKRTVARIVESLSGAVRAGQGARDTSKSLLIRLDDLCGVADITIEKLAALAADGVLTPESAARLACRHSKEIGACTGAHGVGEDPTSQYELLLSGDALRSFAIRVRSRREAPWVGSASSTAYRHLLEVCPIGGRAICLLVGRSESRITTVRLVTTPDWHATLLGRSRRPGWANVKHVLVVGSLPKNRELRAAVLTAVEDALRHRSDLMLTAPSGRPRTEGDCRYEAVAAEVLTLLAVASSGLLRLRREGTCL